MSLTSCSRSTQCQFLFRSSLLLPVVSLFRVLHILSPGGPSPIAPVDMAVRICLASSPPLRSFLTNYDNPLLKRCEPLRPCLSNVAMATTTSTSASTELGSSPAWVKRKKKKSVVFADSRGLALAAVHVFNEAEDNLLTELQFHLTEIEGATAGLHLGDNEGEWLVVNSPICQSTETHWQPFWSLIISVWSYLFSFQPLNFTHLLF